jgi:polyphosphate kinase 2 (PPK2 family)
MSDNPKTIEPVRLPTATEIIVEQRNSWVQRALNLEVENLMLKGQLKEALDHIAELERLK